MYCTQSTIIKLWNVTVKTAVTHFRLDVIPNCPSVNETKPRLSISHSLTAFALTQLSFKQPIIPKISLQVSLGL